MNQQEFEKLTGWVVDPEDYKEYEALYMATGDGMDKVAFCEDLVEHHSSAIIEYLHKELKRVKSKNMEESRERIQMMEKHDIERKEMIDFLITEAHEMSSSNARMKAIRLMGGRAPYLAEIMKRGYNLWEIDREDLIDVLNNI